MVSKHAKAFKKIFHMSDCKTFHVCRRNPVHAEHSAMETIKGFPQGLSVLPPLKQTTKQCITMQFLQAKQTAVAPFESGFLWNWAFHIIALPTERASRQTRPRPTCSGSNLILARKLDSEISAGHASHWSLMSFAVWPFLQRLRLRFGKKNLMISFLKIRQMTSQKATLLVQSSSTDTLSARSSPNNGRPFAFSRALKVDTRNHKVDKDVDNSI